MSTIHSFEQFSSGERELYFDALRELYRRDFPLYAAEQLWLTSTRPGESSTSTPSPRLKRSSIESARRSALSRGGSGWSPSKGDSLVLAPTWSAEPSISPPSPKLPTPSTLPATTIRCRASL